MKNNNSLVFSHEQDVDGLLSAAVLKMAFPQAKVVLTNYGFENMVAIKNRILSFIQQEKQPDDGKSVIVIADIGVNEDSYRPVYEALALAKQKGVSNVWIDHHVWPEGMKEKFSTVCELVLSTEEVQGGEARDGKKCATELCIERFGLTGAHSRTLGAIAHRTDFPDSPRFPIPPLTGIISYYLGKKELNQKLYSVILDNVVRGVLWNTEMQQDMIEASRLIDESMAKSIESMIIRDFEFSRMVPGPDNASTGEKVRVAIARADPFVSRSMLLGRIMDSDAGLEKNIDLAIAYTSDGRLSLRRGDDRSPLKKDATLLLDCSRIAATFREGGGHPGAAGGFLKTNVAEKGEEAAITEIESTLQNYFEQLQDQQDRQ